MQYLTGEKRMPLAKWWSFIRKAPEVWLVNLFDLAHPPVPDVVVLVTLPAARYLERVRMRGIEQQPHHNEAFIERLQEGYRQVARVLSKRRRVDVLEVAWPTGDVERALDELDELSRRRSEAAATPTARG